jgi:translation initiation factor IF-2
MSLAFTFAASTNLFTRDTSPFRQASSSSRRAPLTAGTPGPRPAAPAPKVAVEPTPAASGLSAKLEPGEDGEEDEDEVGEEADDAELFPPPPPPPAGVGATPTAAEAAGTAAGAATVQTAPSTGSGDRGLSGGSRLPSPSGSARPCRGEAKGARPPAVGEAGVGPGAKPGLSGGGGGGGGAEAPGAGWSCC